MLTPLILKDPAPDPPSETAVSKLELSRTTEGLIRPSLLALETVSVPLL